MNLVKVLLLLGLLVLGRANSIRRGKTVLAKPCILTSWAALTADPNECKRCGHQMFKMCGLDGSFQTGVGDWKQLEVHQSPKCGAPVAIEPKSSDAIKDRTCRGLHESKRKDAKVERTTRTEGYDTMWMPKVKENCLKLCEKKKKGSRINCREGCQYGLAPDSKLACKAKCEGKFTASSHTKLDPKQVDILHQRTKFCVPACKFNGTLTDCQKTATKEAGSPTGVSVGCRMNDGCGKKEGQDLLGTFEHGCICMRNTLAKELYKVSKEGVEAAAKLCKKGSGFDEGDRAATKLYYECLSLENYEDVNPALRKIREDHQVCT